MSEKILIVDDELDMLELLELIITDRTSYQVVTVSNPLEVPGLLKEGGFDLLISDLRMPQMDGMELMDQAAPDRPPVALHYPDRLRNR